MSGLGRILITQIYAKPAPCISYAALSILDVHSVRQDVIRSKRILALRRLLDNMDSGLTRDLRAVHLVQLDHDKRIRLQS